jgi:hypothetical protein
MVQSALILSETQRFSGFTIGKAIAIYPEANMVDVLLFDGSIYKQVQVIVPFASSRTGIIGMPLPVRKNDTYRQQQPLGTARQDESDVFVVIGFVGDSIIRPLVFGFLFPEESELLCNSDQAGNMDGTHLLWKHESNVYVRVAKEEPGQRTSTRGETIPKRTPVTPEIEVSHPSGLLIKIGSYDDSKGVGEQRTPIENYDKVLRPFKYKNPETDTLQPAPYVHLYHPSGTYLTVDKDGNVTIYVVGNVVETVEGNVDRTINGNVTELIKQDYTRTVNGDQTDQVDGTWDRTSDTSIQDTAPSVEHNG